MAIKKFIRVTLVDKSEIEVDLKPAITMGMQAHPPALDFNAPANDEFFFRIAQNISLHGLVDENANSNYMKIIPPSQLQTVEVIFEKPAIEIIKN